MKVIRMPMSIAGGTQFAQVTSATMAPTTAALSRVDGVNVGVGLPQGIKVVKLAPTPMASSSQQQHQFFQTRVTQVKRPLDEAVKSFI